MKIDEYLKQNGVDFEMHEHVPTYTAQELASEEHVSGKRLAKSVVVHGDSGYALCVLPAHLKVDLRKAGDALGTESVRLADEQEMAKLFKDVEVGAEPPFGNLYDLPTLVDRRLAEDERIVFQAGTHRHALRMAYADYEKLVQPKVADIAVG